MRDRTRLIAAAAAVAVAEIADLSAAFASALAKGEVAGRAAARVQDQQSWMPRGLDG